MTLSVNLLLTKTSLYYQIIPFSSLLTNNSLLYLLFSICLGLCHLSTMQVNWHPFKSITIKKSMGLLCHALTVLTVLWQQFIDCPTHSKSHILHIFFILYVALVLFLLIWCHLICAYLIISLCLYLYQTHLVPSRFTKLKMLTYLLFPMELITSPKDNNLSTLDELVSYYNKGLQNLLDCLFYPLNFLLYSWTTAT